MKLSKQYILHPKKKRRSKRKWKSMEKEENKQNKKQEFYQEPNKPDDGPSKLQEEEDYKYILDNYHILAHDDFKNEQEDDEQEGNKANKYLAGGFDCLKVDDDKKGISRDIIQEEIEDMDQDDLALQAVLIASMEFNIFSSEATHDLKMNKEDVKMKGKDESCSLKNIVTYCSYRNNEWGESSCTFCVICDDAKPTALMKYNSDCGHSFCEDCIKNYVGETIQDSITEFPCPQSKCKSKLDIKLCNSLMSEEMGEIWRKALMEMNALSEKRFIQCPFRDCLEYFQDDKRGYKIRACPNCWRLICVDCRKPYKYHLGKSCEEFLEFLEEKKQSREKERLLRLWEEHLKENENLLLLLKDPIAEQNAGQNGFLVFLPDK